MLRTIGLRERLRGAALAVTGEGTVDRTSSEGKATGAVVAACLEAGVRCVVFGGRIVEPIPGAEARPLSGSIELAAEDLVELGEELALRAA